MATATAPATEAASELEQMPDLPPLTPAHLRAIVVHAYTIAKSHYRYAQWLRDQGYDGHAAQVTHEGDAAFVYGLGAALDLEVWEETVGVGAGAPRTKRAR